MNYQKFTPQLEQLALSYSILSAPKHKMTGRACEASDWHRSQSEHDPYRLPNVFQRLTSSLQKARYIDLVKIMSAEVFCSPRVDETFVSNGGL